MTGPGVSARTRGPRRRQALAPPGEAAPSRGVTFIELVVSAAIVMLLASVALPVAKTAVRRHREIELRRELRVLRTAIDRYKAAVDAGQIGGSDVQLGSEGYPETLEVLVEGVSQVGRADGHKLRFLRRIPVDPMTREANWGLRCYSDKPDASSWCGDNVFDVYSQSPGRALDGTYYKDW